ncbi:Rieske (2Fe-2S) protein [Sphingobacterium sp. Mn56C]|uniref:Rieske (2Fe-2S) protein n=1 Tax=Sphingobacterium sp. Mn56C TaxID=3395261 RepID=UPI003BDA77E8
MAWIEIPSEYLNEKGKVQLVELPEGSFCLVYDKDKWVAFSKKCPHAGAPLVAGWCEAGDIVCAYHRHRFSLATGRGAAGQGNYISLYPLRWEGDTLYIALKDSFFKRLLR